MNTTTNSLVQKLWNYCNVLRDDGMSYRVRKMAMRLCLSPHSPPIRAIGIGFDVVQLSWNGAIGHKKAPVLWRLRRCHNPRP